MGQGVERALRTLQHSLREPHAGEDDRGFMVRSLPLELVHDGGPTAVRLPGRIRDALRTTEESVDSDLRFEHLKDAGEAVWQFASRALLYRRGDHVAWFIERYAKPPTQHRCFFPVEYLTVHSEFELGGVRLLPTHDFALPAGSRTLVLQEPVGSVAVADVVGTNRERIAQRGRERVEHALRLLRTALRDHESIADQQLRFVVGTSHAFDEKSGGWKQRDDVAYELGLNEDLIQLVRQHPVSTLAPEPRNKAERAADLAVRWMERARMTGEPVVSLLYNVFAVEALLGDVAAGEKGYKVAFRQALLSHAASGGFRHPSEFVVLYEDVRSAAVHGGAFRQVTKREASNLSWAVKDTLKEYLVVVRDRGFTKQTQVASFLDAHPDRRALVDWLRANGGLGWNEYFDRAGVVGTGRSGG